MNHFQRGIECLEVEQDIIRVAFEAAWILNPHCLEWVENSEHLGGIWFCQNRAADNLSRYCEGHWEREQKWRDEDDWTPEFEE